MSAETPTPSAPRASGASRGHEGLFGQAFVHDVLRWSVFTAAVGGIVGWLATAQIAFALALWAGAAVDITTFRILAVRGQRAMVVQESERTRLSAWPGAMLAWRLVAKAVLLVIAIFLPWPGAFWGVFFGILVVEFMLVVVGIVRSIRLSFGSGSGTGRGVRS